jgi:NAD(P)-dependent dehydrogenase (short-subunit alcohol dehydrogenase family)
MDRLKGKVAIITGGAGGIGKAVGALYASQGSDVLLVDVNEQALKDACDEIGSNRVSFFVGDVTSAADNEAMVQTATERYGGVDVFVANAGVEGEMKSILEYDEGRFDQLMAINVKGPFLGLKAAIPALEKRGGGSVIITSSVAGITGAAGMAPYVTSKHAVIGLMKSAAKECAALNIRVNTVNPSPVHTQMMRRIEEGFAPGAGESVVASLEQQIPLGRYAEAKDVARVMLFLASDDSEFVTGSVQMVDGGLTA